ncbi:hypothetical protein KCV04_g22188, partial [Aureobasidium melanogenum]
MTGRLIDVDASPWLWVETTWAVILCALAFVVRLVVRGHECGLEDLLLILAFILAIASFGCIYQALHDGLVCHEEFLFVFRCRRLLEAVNGGNAVQNHLQRHHERQKVHRSVCWWFRTYRYMGDFRCCYLGFSLFAATSIICASVGGLQS